jgi:hypothetical protein
MSGTFAAFKSDVDRERNGLWLDYGDAGEFLVARAGGANKAYEKALARITKPHRRALEAEAIDSDKAFDLMKQAFAETIVLDWKGITDAEGNEVPYSKEKCLWLFRELDDLFQAIREDAHKATLYRASLREEAAGN